MVRLTYTATFGSYYKPEETNKTIPGWERPMTVNPKVGMRALLFLQNSTRRGVVAMIVIKFKEKFAGDGGIMDSLLEKMDSEISRAFTNN
mgnify:CR=1 FL=1